MVVKGKNEYKNQTQKTAREKSIQLRVKQPPAERNEVYGWRSTAKQTDAEASWWHRDGNTTF